MEMKPINKGAAPHRRFCDPKCRLKAWRKKKQEAKS